MNGIQAIISTLKSTQDMVNMFLADLDDADLLVRPVPGANHIAWQLGHLVFAEAYQMNAVYPEVKYPDMPEISQEKYGKEGSAKDDPKEFLTKSQYLHLFNTCRGITLNHLGHLKDEDLDRPTESVFKDFAPRHGELFLLMGNHTMMHLGQFTVVRRKLGKPVLF